MSKILVFGDSIAYGKWDSQGGWVAKLRRYIDDRHNLDGKNQNFQVYNMGIPGEVAPRIAVRLQEEMRFRVFDAGPDLVLLAVGINDSCPNNWMTQEQTPENEFKQAIKKMTRLVKAHKVRVACVGLTPVLEEKLPSLKFTNQEIKKYDNYLTQICQENSIPKLELFDSLLNSDYISTLTDGIHPNDTGHQIIATKVINFLSAKYLFPNID